MSTLARVQPRSGTGTGGFDVPDVFDRWRLEDASARTRLILEDIPNLDLGAVLRKWDDTLSPGCLARTGSWSSATLGLTLPDLDMAEVEEIYPLTSPGLRVLEEFANSDTATAQTPLAAALEKSVDATLDVDYRDEVRDELLGGVISEAGDDASTPLCRLVVGPVTPSRPYSQPLWILVTGDEISQVPTGGLFESVAAATRHARALLARRPEPSAVEVIADLQDLLGVPAATILRASGISRRTYQHWKATGATPRLASQARLWDLALAARGWADTLGDDLGAWIRRPDRLDLLDDGHLDALTGQVLAVQARQVTDSAWYSDRLAASYFETTDAELAAGEADRDGPTRGRQPRVGRRARRGTPAGEVRRSTN